MTNAMDLTLEQCIGLKLMLDIRAFDSGNGPVPVQQLPPQLKQGLVEISPCGVILFREKPGIDSAMPAAHRRDS